MLFLYPSEFSIVFGNRMDEGATRNAHPVFNMTIQNPVVTGDRRTRE
jgi:hypothetical protein